MEISWDIQALRARIGQLPQELALILDGHDNSLYLQTLGLLLLDRRYTDAVLVCCEPTLSHCCDQIKTNNKPVAVLAVYGRILPFAPYLAECAERFFSDRRHDLLPQDAVDEDVLEYLLGLYRLLRFDHSTFADFARFSQIESFLKHSHAAVRYLAIRILCLQLHAADSATLQIVKRIIPEGDAQGLWEGKEIHYKYLSLWEGQRYEEVKGKLKAAYRERAGSRQANSRSLNENDFNSSTSLISGVLLPRYKLTTSASSTSPSFVQTPTTSRNLRSFASNLKYVRPLLLTGLAGSGKTAIVRYVASKLNMLDSMITLHLNEQSDAKSLIGMYTTGSTPGTFTWQPGVLTKAVLEGRWVLIEDVDRAPSEILSVLLPLIERRELMIPGREQPVKAARGFRILASLRTSLNVRGEEFRPAIAMLGARHWKLVHVSTPAMAELGQTITGLFPGLAEYASTLVDVFDQLQQLKRQSVLESRSKTGVMRVISQRDLLKWSSRVAHMLANKSTKTSQDEDQMFLDAVDCFVGSLAPGMAYDALTSTIAQHLQIDPQRKDHLLSSRVVPYHVGEKVITIGRNRFVRLQRRNLLASGRRAFSTNAHTLRLLDRVGVSVAEREPLLLVGETGTGKTTSVQHLADELGKKLVPFNLSQQSESGDLLGGFKPVNIRTLMVPLKDEFDELFSSSFPPKVVLQNQPFFDKMGRCMAKGQWLRLCKLWHEAFGNVEKLRKSSLANGSSSPAHKAENSNKKRRVAHGLTTSINKRWDTFATDFHNIERRLLAGSESSFAFSFVEGNIVKAVRNGDWILLDEINLATPDTLEAIADLFDTTPSIMLSDAGSVERITAHPDFRVFAAMNPATDVGKKDLPQSIRSRFTELYVESPDRDLQSLRSIVQVYLGPNEAVVASDVSNLHRAIQDMAQKDVLVDGAGQKPHFSLRTLTRALTYAKDVMSQCSLRRALYEGFQMSFMTMLDDESKAILMPAIQTHLFHSQPKYTNEIKQALRQPKGNDKDQYINEGRYWLKQGSSPVEEQPFYIITDFVRRNLDNLIRASSTRRFPVLLQGPTSSGKTSMVEYLAKRSGNNFVRINNHEHTDLQEYLGAYVSKPNGKLEFQEGILVRALRDGHWLVLDELNLAPTDVLEALNRLLDDNRELLIPETQETVRPHENFMLFATQNPAGLYGGRKVLSRAFRNRFLELHFDDIPIDELHIILHRRTQIPNSWSQRIVSVYKELAILRQENRLFEQKSFATLRDLFRWALRPADTIEQLAVNGFMLLAERVRKLDERQAIKRVIEKVLSQRGPKVVIDEAKLYDQSALGLSEVAGLSLRSQGAVWTSAMRRLYVLASQAIRSNEPVLLVGETGCGKTTVCQMLGLALGRQLHIVNAHQNTETGDLIGAQRPARNRAAIEQQIRDALSTLPDDKIQYALETSTLDDALALFDQAYAARSSEWDGTAVVEKANLIQDARVHLKTLFEWSDGSLVHAMKAGEFFLLDEISLADDSVLERLNSVLESQRSLLLAEKGSLDSFVVAQEGFQFFATMNPGGDYGKKELSPALRNRFTEIWVPTLSDVEDVLQIVRAKLHNPSLADAVVSFAQWFHERYNRTASTSISIRDALAWAQFINSFPHDSIKGTLHGAAMVYIDSLGANPAGLLAISSAEVEAERLECLKELGRLLDVDAVALYAAPIGYELKPASLALGDFQIPRINDLGVNPTFTFAAPTTRSNAMRVVRALQLTKPILLEGNPGVGKTTLVTALAQLVGIPLTRINLSEQTDLMDLFGSDIPVEGAEAGHFAWRDAPFLRAMKAGEWVLLDEMNLASQSVLEGLNACLDHRGEVYISELDQTFSRHPDFRLFAAQNPHHQGGGRKGLPASFVNRFTVVYADVFRREDLLTICSSCFPTADATQLQSVVDFVGRLDTETEQRHFGVAGGPWEFNLRDALRWLSLITSEKGLLQTGGSFNFLQMIVTQRFRTVKDRSDTISLYRSIFQTVPSPHSLFHNLTEDIFQVGMGTMQRDSLYNPLATKAFRPFDCKPHLPVLESMVISIQQRWPLILVGPSGSGKTSLLEKLAQIAGASLVTLPLNSDIDAMDLVGGYEQSDPQRRVDRILDKVWRFFEYRKIFNLTGSKNTEADCSDMDWLAANIRPSNRQPVDKGSLQHIMTLLERSHGLTEAQDLREEVADLFSASLTVDRAQFEWVDGGLVQAMQRGDWLVLDNANLCSAAVLDRLNSLLEPNGQLIINEHTDNSGQPHVISPHADFRIFLTMDPKYGELSRALRNRAVELCLLSQDETQTDSTSILHISTESDLYRFNGANITSVFDSQEGATQAADFVMDHLSVQDHASVSSFLQQTNRGLFKCQESNLTASAQTLGESGLLHSPVKLPLYSSDTDERFTALQTIHPLNNELVFRLFNVDSQSARWSALMFDTRVELARMQDAVANLAAPRGPQQKLTRLQRSASAGSIANVARDSTIGVYPFLIGLCTAVSKWSSKRLSASDVHTGLLTLDSLSSLRRFWWEMLSHTSSMSFDEATYQAYVELGVSLVLAMSTGTETASVLKESLQALTDKLQPSSRVTNGDSILALWSALKPETPRNIEQLQVVVGLEQLADRFDSYAWSFQASIKQLLALRRSFGESLKLAIGGAGSDLVQVLEAAMEDMNVDVKPLEETPHFQRQFEAICELFDLLGASGSSRPQQYENTYPAVSLLALRPTKTLRIDGHASRKNSAVIDIFQALGSYVGAYSSERRSIALAEGTCPNMLSTLHGSDEVALREMNLLQQETSVLGTMVGAHANTMAVDHERLLAGVLEQLLIRICHILGSKSGDSQILQDGSALLATTKAASFQLSGSQGNMEPKKDVQYIVDVVDQYLKPAALLIENAETASRNHDLSLAAASNAWISFALGCILLYVPGQAFDPALKPLIRRDMYHKERTLLEGRLSGLRVSEMHFSGQSTSLRIRFLEEELYRLGHEPVVEEIARPRESQMSRLQGEFNALMRTLSPLLKLDTSSLATNATDTVLQSNIYQLKQRLTEGFRAYSDITAPLLGFLHCLEVGFTLAHQAENARSSGPHGSLDFCTLVPLLGAVPQQWTDGTLIKQATLQDLPIQMHALASFSTTIRLLPTARVSDQAWDNVRWAFDSIYHQWRLELQSKQHETAANSSIYRYRGGDDFEEEVEDEEYRSMFPDYDAVQDDEQGSRDSPSKNIHGLAPELATILESIVTADSLPSNPILALINKAATSSHKFRAPSNANSSTFGGNDSMTLIIKMLDDKCQELNESKPPPTYNIYTDANLMEMRRLVALVKRVQDRFRIIQEAWPEHATLADVLRVCEELLAFKHTEVVVKFMAKLEKLHEFVHEWQKVASSQYSALAIYDSITDMLVSWRRLELSTWSRLLDMEVAKCNEDARSWFFIAYESIVSVPSSIGTSSEQMRTHVIGLLKTLEGFFLTTGIGQYAERLRMLRTFHNYIRVLANATPVLRFVGDALGNFISYMARFEGPIAAAIAKGRQELEKKVKEIIQLASWKDRTIDALRQSAKASHRKLFRVIRKFRALLGQPADAILRAGVSEAFALPVTDGRQPTLVRINAEVNPEAREICQSNLSSWSDIAARFKNTTATVSVMQSMIRGPPGELNAAVEVNSWLSDIEEIASQLRKATPAKLTEENKETVQHLKVRKRTLFADVLRELRKMGFKSSLGGDALAQQDSLQIVLATIPAFTTASAPAAERELYQMLHYMPQARNAAREHSGDLTGAEITRSISLLESMLQVVMQQRTTICHVQSGQNGLDETIASLQGFVQGVSLQMAPDRNIACYRLEDAINCLPALLLATVDILEAQGRLAQLNGAAVPNELRDFARDIDGLKTRWQSQPSMPPGTTTAEIVRLQEDSRTALVTLRTNLESATQSHPYFGPVLTQLLLWTSISAEAPDSTVESNKAGRVKLQEYNLALCEFVDLILGSLEDVRKALALLPTSVENPSWVTQENTCMRLASKSLRVQHVAAMLDHLLKQIQDLDNSEHSLDVAAALLANYMPIVLQYRAICDFVRQRLCSLHTATCLMSSHLAQIFTKLAHEGFCTPSEKSSGKDDKSDQVEGGTGLGDGEGGEDISKDIQDDEDLTELAQEPNQKNDKEEIEDEKDAVDMADQDLEGEMGDAEEKGEDEEGDSGSEGEEEDIEEETGDVDDLGPSAVDEKMWDDGGKDADKDKETDKADGETDKNEVSAAEGEQKDKNEERKEDGAENAPEEEAGVDESEEVGREQTEKADPHMDEQDNLDLPDDIDMDGEGSEKDIDSDMEMDDMEQEPGVDEMPTDGVEDEQKGDQDAAESDPGSPVISETEENPETQEEGADDESADKTQDAGEEAEEEATEDDNLLQDQRQDDSTAAEDIAPSDAQGTGLNDQQMQDQENEQETGAAQQEQGTEGAAPEQEEAAGAQGQRGKANEDKASGDQDEEDHHDQESLPYKKLGDALEKWYRQHQQIADAQEQEKVQEQNKDTDMANAEFEHLPDESIEADAQALGGASEEQATAIDEDAGVSANETETHEHFPPEEQANSPAKGEDHDMQDVEPTDADQEVDTEGRPNAFVGEYHDETRDADDSRYETIDEEEAIDDVDTQLNSTHLDRLTKDEPDMAMDEARQLWLQHEASTRNLALVLTEHLRLILSPTQATKMRGDFRTGKRLNIKRIIPYIASQYKRDKIWMRRSVPSKRTYQIMLAIDDSKSMAESNSSTLAFDTLALVAKSLSMLEAGELCIVGFGEDVHVAHDFSVPFTSDAGAEVVRHFGFEQTQTDVQKLLSQTLELFRTARTRASSAASELWQLQFIISDGVCKDHAGIRRLVRQGEEERIMTVFVIVDAAAGTKEGGSSILDLQTARFGKDDKGQMTVDTVKYLETFPFRYYLIVRDVVELPGVLASALRQWFAEVVDTGGQ